MLIPTIKNESIQSELNRLSRKLIEQSSELLGFTITLFDETTHKIRSFFRSEYFDTRLPVISTRLQDSSVLMAMKADPYTHIVINEVDEHNQSILDILKSVSRRRHDDSTDYSILCIPVHHEDRFLGGIFLLANRNHYFEGTTKMLCDSYGMLIAQITINYLNIVDEFSRVAKALLAISHHRDPETKAHLKRMREYSRLIASNLYEKGLCSDLLSNKIAQYADMHDIGKYGIPDEILFSTKRFNDEERSIMNRHPEMGVKMLNEMLSIFHLNRSDDVQVLTNIILHHHERFDGHGYPHKLGGKAIPLEARIVAAADVLDALLSPRTYKKAWPMEKVMAYFREESGKHFDPDCAQAVLNNQDAIVFIQEHYKDET